MADYVVWLDSQKAEIFALRSNGVFKTHLDKQTDSERFFADITARLVESNQLLLLGPGLAKSHFKTHIETYEMGGLAKRIVAVETLGNPSDSQILDKAREYFKDYRLFDTIIKN